MIWLLRFIDSDALSKSGALEIQTDELWLYVTRFEELCFFLHPTLNSFNVTWCNCNKFVGLDTIKREGNEDTYYFGTIIHSATLICKSFAYRINYFEGSDYNATHAHDKLLLDYTSSSRSNSATAPQVTNPFESSQVRFSYFRFYLLFKCTGAFLVNWQFSKFVSIPR